ncbi:hypothetical protein QBC40DRAFT_309954 [Triangularia verruculosa]|uniref:Uncharacterized protein n=1 Tax=Triangularia verruculosa TaxID=2587418 RepID=A0AAN6XEI2_9PEZI|nr:hypothetical protein QBC40DRAFT_309954 [Triangularia verruculosa]
MIANVKARDPTDSMSFCAGVAVGGPGTNILPVNLMWHADKNRPMEEVKLRDTTTWKQRAPSWSWASLEGPVAWEPFVLDGRVECHTEVLGGVPYGLTPDDQTVREARLLFRGLAAEVMRSPAEKLGDVGCDIHAYLLDFEEHAACYALLGGVGKEVLGWGVFDRGDKVAGPFMAVVVSRNVDEEDAQCQSLNVLLVKQSAAETGYVYVRVGMGELTNFANLEFKERELIIA